MAYIFGSVWDRNNRNALNELSKSVVQQGVSIQDLVAKGQLTPTQYAELISIINGNVKKGSITTADIDKNNFKVDQTMITESLLQQIAGTTEINAVPANNSIGTIKIIDDSITRRKRTVGGEFASVLNNGSPLNINTKDKVIEVEAGTFIYTSQQRYQILESVSAPFYSGSSNIVIYETETNVLRVTHGSSVHAISEDSVVLMQLQFTDSSHTEIRSVVGNLEYTVNGKNRVIVDSVHTDEIVDKAVTSNKIDIPYNGLAETYVFEPGAISSSSGELYDSPTGVRTKELIYLEQGDRIELEDENTEFIITKYDESGEFIERAHSGWAKTYTADENMYIKILHRFVGGTVVADVSYLSNNLYTLKKETFITRNEVDNKLEKSQYETDLLNNNYGDVIDTIENELVIPPGSFYSYYSYQNENDFEKGKTLYFLVETNKVDGSWAKEICIRENGGGGGTNEKRTNSEHLGDGVYLVTHKHIRDPDDRVHAFVNNMTFENPLTVYDAVLLYEGADGRALDRRIKNIASTAVVDVSSLHDRIAILNDGIVELVDRINEEKGIKKTWKVLSIGNSFSNNVQTYLTYIAKSAGVNIICGNAAIGGSTLEQNYINATTGESYGYTKRFHIDGAQSTESGSVTISEAVLDEDWDIITLQQGSRYSGLYESYQPHLNNLISFVRGKATNPFMKIVWHMTWAYATHTSGGPFLNYNNDQQIMYDGIMSSVKNVLKETEIHSIIPSGTAIQNARTSDVLNADEMELTLNDGHHLNDLGCFVGGLTVFESLINGDKTLDDVTFIPTGITETQAAQAKIAVENAVNNPFSVTEM